jgi:hypothetical protein
LSGPLETSALRDTPSAAAPFTAFSAIAKTLLI